MTSAVAIQTRLSDVLALLEPYRSEAAALGGSAVSLPSLLEQCEDRCAANAEDAQRPVASIHHFACTGGTLMSRALAVQPGAVLLSEVDPFSTLGLQSGRFAPTDIIMQARKGLRGVSQDVVGEIFLSGLSVLCTHVRGQGGYLVLRDHSHSHFCMADTDPDRPVLGDVLRRQFALKSVVTVRHPLDSYLSLTDRGWVHFAPATIEEYAQRYMAFLDIYSVQPIFRYEDFVADPDAIIAQICNQLGLPFTPDWQDFLPLAHLSGNSGRKGAQISARPRRPIPDDIQTQEHASPTYDALCARLKYNPAFAARPL